MSYVHTNVYNFKKKLFGEFSQKNFHLKIIEIWTDYWKTFCTDKNPELEILDKFQNFKKIFIVKKLMEKLISKI